MEKGPLRRYTIELVEQVVPKVAYIGSPTDEAVPEGQIKISDGAFWVR
jgi:hypothetical protein